MHSIKHLVIGHVFQTEPSSEQTNGMTATRTFCLPSASNCVLTHAIGVSPTRWGRSRSVVQYVLHYSMCCTTGRRMMSKLVGSSLFAQTGCVIFNLTSTNVQPFLILTLQIQPAAALG